jgi:cell division septation protein DedD
MQNQVYARYLYRMLMEYGSVFIPEVGRFSLDFRSASFQQYMTVLNPPSTIVLFDFNSTTLPTFAERLMEAGMDRALASHAQSILISDYNNAIESNKAFVLQDFGYIENGIFTPKDEDAFNLYRGLKEISVTPQPTLIRHDETFLSDINKKRVEENPSALSKYWLPILASLIVAGFIIFWFIRPNTTVLPPNSASVQPHQEVTHVEVLPSGDTISDNDMEIDNKASETPIVQPATLETNIEKPEKYPVSEKSKALTSTKSVQTNTSTNGSACVVIVGAFKNHNNAVKLKALIQKKGYQTYVADNGGLRRVGIKFDCSKTDAESFKEEIRSKINKDAWLLDE